MTPLCELAIKYGTDKYSKHHYTPVYYDILKDRISTTKSVLEVGIKRGASLRMWRDFFPNALVCGIDIKVNRLINDERISSRWGDQGKPDTMKLAVKDLFPDGLFDFIVDDGTHKAVYQIMTAQTLLPFLAHDGVYVIEDVKHGPEDNPAEIRLAMPREYRFEMFYTNTILDSALIVLRREAQ